MNHNTALILSELPEVDGWDFGDFPYGLEPLTLPSPDATEDSAEDQRHQVATRRDFEDACRRLLTMDGRHPASAELRPLESPDRLFHFRWITGHQVTFIIWQLLTRVMRTVEARAGQTDPATVAAMADYANGYCAMLLYSSSCPPDIYHTVIRPSMFLQHKKFSGTWAPDFGPVRELFRNMDLGWNRGPDTVPLRAAIDTYQAIHAGVAAKLVPSGRSLLQESASVTHLQHPDLPGVVYDNYFMTLRAPTSRHDIVAQLLRRLNAAALDVAVNGLYPVSPEGGQIKGTDEQPEELERPEVFACERDFFSHLFRVAGVAAGLSLDDLRSQLPSQPSPSR